MRAPALSTLYLATIGPTLFAIQGSQLSHFLTSHAAQTSLKQETTLRNPFSLLEIPLEFSLMLNSNFYPENHQPGKHNSTLLAPRKGELRHRAHPWISDWRTVWASSNSFTTDPSHCIWQNVSFQLFFLEILVFNSMHVVRGMTFRTAMCSSTQMFHICHVTWTLWLTPNLQKSKKPPT